MKTVSPFITACIAGGLSAVTSFFLIAGAQDEPDIAASRHYETAIFAGGCFWCVEADFDQVDGVVDTVSGYTGGVSDRPTYRSHSREGHLEAVRVLYDPETVDYTHLVEVFMRSIDPTDDTGQFCDRGPSYTTAVFVGNDEERGIVESVFADIRASGVLPGPLVTDIRPTEAFHRAETYHQDYYLKNSRQYKFYRRACGRDARLREVWSGSGSL